MRKWIINKPNNDAVKRLITQSNLGKLSAEVISSRGMTDVGQVSEFLNVSELSNPFQLKDMHEAVNTIEEAVNNGDKICIYGDYDCDGITSTVMLYSYLECLGADISYYIPERSEGYGMNEQSIRKIADSGVNLIITVDNGISAIAEADLVYELGMKLVVTDHHQVGEVLPRAEAVVDAHRTDCPSIYKNLCGAGVVLKMIAALEGGTYEVAMEQFGELAALGTVADIVKLDGENRCIVEHGLTFMQNTERTGLVSLIEVSGLSEKKITSTSLAFMLAPRINAASRFGSPKQAFNLLMADNSEISDELAEELNTLNTRRKNAETDIMNEIGNYVNSNPSVLDKRVLVLHGNGWHHGVIGIVASRVSEIFGKPCFIITVEGETARGSARTFGGFSAYKCLDYCSELLIKYGGHMGAGGFSLNSVNIEKFDIKVQEFAKNNFENMPLPILYADKLLEPKDIICTDIENLKLLEPFGEGNNEPLFCIHGAQIIDSKLLSNGEHIKLRLKYGNATIDALIFRVKHSNIIIDKGELWDFMVTLDVNTYRNVKSPVAIVKDYRKCGLKQDKYFSAKVSYEKYKRGEELSKLYYSRMCPSRDELISVYKMLSDNKITIDMLYTKCCSNEMNYCKLKIAVDIFVELGIAEFNPFTEEINLIINTSKKNLESSEILRDLRNKL